MDRCEYKLTREDISALISFLHAEKDAIRDVRQYSPDEGTKEESEGLVDFALFHADNKKRIQVFGDTYQEVYHNSRLHVMNCEPCKQFYKIELVMTITQIDRLRRRLSEKGFITYKNVQLEEAAKFYDSKFLGIL